MVVLKRWGDSGEVNLECICADPYITFHGNVYRLCGVVVHLGASKDSGHYVAVTKHGQEEQDWWLYDDQSRKLASDDQASTMQNEYQFWGNMKSYILLYEIVDDS